MSEKLISIFRVDEHRWTYVPEKAKAGDIIFDDIINKHIELIDGPDGKLRYRETRKRRVK